MERRTVVKGAAWAMPAIVMAAAAPTVAASGPPASIGEACKMPDHRVSSDYRLTLDVTETHAILAVKIKGVPAAFVPNVVTTTAPNIVVSTLPNADSQIDFEIVTDKAVIRQTVKALPCKD